MVILKQDTAENHKRNKLQPQPQSQSQSDRLTSLPDCLLVSILSLLPTKTAVTTSVLSTRWQHLPTQLSHLKFFRDDLMPWSEEPNYEARLNSFISNVNHIFQHLTSSKLHTFDLEYPTHIENDTQLHLFDSALELWGRKICRLNVERVRVSRLFDDQRFLLLPSCIFQCESLVVLQVLNGGFRVKFPENEIVTRLPNLRKLTLTRIHEWDCKTMSTLFKSCVVLEELELSFWEQVNDQFYQPVRIDIDISCVNLRLLRISHMYISRKGSNYVINAPRLEVIYIQDSVPCNFRLVKTPVSLIKAKIKLEMRGEDDYGQLSEVVHWICYAKSLELSSIVLTPLGYLDDSALPRYGNLSQIRVYLNDIDGCNNIVRCLHCAPNLEAIVIEMNCDDKGVEWREPDTIPACFTRNLRTIEVKYFKGSKNELKFLKYILSNATGLKLLRVGVFSSSTTQLGKEARFCNSLFECPRNSEACVIQFNGTYIQSSSTDGHSPLTLQ